MNVILYHNPRCSKSRETLALIRTAGIEPRIVEYIDAPLSRAELESLLGALQLPVSGLMRTGDALYTELGLDTENCNDSRRLDALVEYPVLFNRPVAVSEHGARICRPPEMVLEILPVINST
ncbi:MAG: arsenate reductase (glutaredoxin) [Arenimonas sp.]|nr:arsenate reductase (glutaredoxin) [Arenimonas sp.]MBP7916960.1 arsenate reductase (glutaredoxin) [Arenimonas sp.]